MLKQYQKTDIAYQIKYLHKKGLKPNEIRKRLKASLPLSKIPSFKVNKNKTRKRKSLNKIYFSIKLITKIAKTNLKKCRRLY